MLPFHPCIPVTGARTHMPFLLLAEDRWRDIKACDLTWGALDAPEIMPTGALMVVYPAQVDWLGERSPFIALQACYRELPF